MKAEPKTTADNTRRIYVLAAIEADLHRRAGACDPDSLAEINALLRKQGRALRLMRRLLD